MKILIKRLDQELPLPEHATVGDAGVDLRARRAGRLVPGERAAVATGVAVAIPEGHVGLVTPRSSLAVRFGLTVVNSPGVVDSGYRGELKIVLANTGEEDFVFERGHRIAQMVVVPFVVQEFDVVDVLPESVRGIGGFGSTGS